MKAILKTYASEKVSNYQLVEISDHHDFTDSYADTVPFAVGSNQEILEYAPLIHDNLLPVA